MIQEKIEKDPDANPGRMSVRSGRLCHRSTKGEPTLDGGQHSSDLESALSDAHMEVGQRRKLISSIAASLFPPHRLLGLRAVRRELCTLPSRIAILRSNNWFRYGIPLESPSQQENFPRAIRDKFRRARIRGIRKARSIYPALSPLDLYILLRTIDRDLFEEDEGKAGE